MIIYLDQNKWIEVAKMVHGKDKSARAKRVLSDLEAASDGRYAELPLSSFHYIEASRISNVARKIRLGAVMWRFSRGMTIIGYPAVVRNELETALAQAFSSDHSRRYLYPWARPRARILHAPFTGRIGAHRRRSRTFDACLKTSIGHQTAGIAQHQVP